MQKHMDCCCECVCSLPVRKPITSRRHYFHAAVQLAHILVKRTNLRHMCASCNLFDGVVLLLVDAHAHVGSTIRFSAIGTKLSKYLERYQCV